MIIKRCFMLLLMGWALSVPAVVTVVNDTNDPWSRSEIVPYPSELDSWDVMVGKTQTSQLSTLTVKVTGQSDVLLYWKYESDEQMFGSDRRIRFSVDGNVQEDWPMEDTSSEWRTVSIHPSSSGEHELSCYVQNDTDSEVHVFVWSESLSTGKSSGWVESVDPLYHEGTVYEFKGDENGGTTSFSIVIPGDSYYWKNVYFHQGANDKGRLRMFMDGEECLDICQMDDFWYGPYFPDEDRDFHLVTWTYESSSGTIPEDVFIKYYEESAQIVDYCESVVESTFHVDQVNMGRETVRQILDDEGGILYETSATNAWMEYSGDGVNGNSMRSCVVSDSAESWMKATVVGHGEFCFSIKVPYGRMQIDVDGVCYGTYYKTGGWKELSLKFSDEGQHSVRWNVLDGFGLVDAVSWKAPEGWDDPEDHVVATICCTSFCMDIQSSPHVVRCEECRFPQTLITYDPSWIGASSVMVKVNGELLKTDTKSDYLFWYPQKYGEYVLTLEYLDGAGKILPHSLTSTQIFRCTGGTVIMFLGK